MSYEAAFNQAWEELAALQSDTSISLKFLADEYALDCGKRSVLSVSCNVPAKEHTAILILHYLIRKLRGLPAVLNEWISFRELEGGESYYPAFRKRALEPLIRKYGRDPKALLARAGALQLKQINHADTAVVVEAFQGVPVMVALWRGDEDFGPEANMLFDKNIPNIFCTEDVVVLAGIVATGL